MIFHAECEGLKKECVKNCSKSPDNPNMEVNFHSTCDSSGEPKRVNLYQSGSLSDVDWTLIALVRQHIIITPHLSCMQIIVCKRGWGRP